MATLDREALRRKLLTEDGEFGALAAAHLSYERRLRELTSLRYPTAAEQLEEIVLKKRRLAVKDRMAEIMRLNAS
jgi:uncharacterized protein YdcH (DUF465 family)